MPVWTTIDGPREFDRFNSPATIVTNQNTNIACSGGTSGESGDVTNPLEGTLRVQNIETAYDTTPVDLNVFIQTTVNETSALAEKTANQTRNGVDTTFTGSLVCVYVCVCVCVCMCVCLFV